MFSDQGPWKDAKWARPAAWETTEQQGQVSNVGSVPNAGAPSNVGGGVVGNHGNGHSHGHGQMALAPAHDREDVDPRVDTPLRH